jgi:head-tail adaptor
MGAGALRSVLAYETRAEIDDGAGNPVSGPWTEQFRTAAQVHPLRGSEAVMASRLQCVQPYLVTVRCTAASLAITTDGRLRDTRSGVTYNITSAVPREKRDYVDVLCVAGTAE